MAQAGVAVQQDSSAAKEAPGNQAAFVNGLRNRIAQRAYELFDGHGRRDGRDLDDWLQAEAQFLHPLHIQLSESPDAVTVRAEVPGFTLSQLKIDVEPRCVTITGERETKQESTTKEMIYSEVCSDQILRVLDLPAAVDPATVKTTLKDGVLELLMTKAAPATGSESGAKAA